MRSDMRGRQACALSEYHQRMHETAVKRANAMAARRAQGWTYEAIGEEFGCSRQAVIQAIKRQEQRTR